MSALFTDRIPNQVRMALEARDLKKIRKLAQAYSEGIGIRKNRKIAFLLFKAGTELGDAELAWSAADACEYGLGVEKSLVDAEAYYKKAARLGSPEATTGLAYLYWHKETGEYRRKAIALYRRAARKGEPHALHNIGVCYSTGKGLRKNLPLALKYFTRAAQGGHLEAVFKVGCCYLYGEGVKIDEKEGLRCLRYAAKYGHRDAEKLLTKIDQQKRDGVKTAKNPETRR